MKTLFIPARFIGKVRLKKSMIDKLPMSVGLVSTTQFLGSISSIKKQIEDSGRRVFVGDSLQGSKGHILGCDVSSAKAVDSEINAFLYIGSGEFHPRGVALETERDIFMFNPITNRFTRLDKNEIKKYKMRKKSAYLRFLSAKSIGIIVSTKQGQNNLLRALELRKRLKEKNSYIFIFDTIDFRELENFPFIDAWVNTACPRIDEDIDCVTLSDIEAQIR
ncbi:MAG: diphthamide synthesis protein [Nanoarchaeota archaeon]